MSWFSRICVMTCEKLESFAPGPMTAPITPCYPCADDGWMDKHATHCNLVAFWEISLISQTKVGQEPSRVYKDESKLGTKSIATDSSPVLLS